MVGSALGCGFGSSGRPHLPRRSRKGARAAQAGVGASASTTGSSSSGLGGGGGSSGQGGSWLDTGFKAATGVGATYAVIRAIQQPLEKQLDKVEATLKERADKLEASLEKGLNALKSEIKTLRELLMQQGCSQKKGK